MTKDAIRPNLAATMMAAVPFRDPQLTARIILDNCPEAPRLPIMTRSFRWLYEGVPCLHLDKKKKQVYMLPPEEREEEVLAFYERVEADDLDYFATTAATAPFYYEVVEQLQKLAGPEMKWIAVQVPGPMVLGDTFWQTNGMPACQHGTLWDIIVKSVAMKSRWLEQMLAQAFPGTRVITDHPEPTLVNFTSAQGTGSEEEVINCVNNAFEGVRGVRWVHCCSNVDWSLLTRSEIDVINFDAFEHADKVALYAPQIQAFLERGGALGWGIVPVREHLIVEEDADSLTDRLRKGFDLMIQGGVDADLLAASSWVLTACETALLNEDLGKKAFELVRAVSHRMREDLKISNPH